MKEIKFAGYEAKGKLSASIVGRGEIDLFKINTDGMLIETTTKLNMNSIYRFQINADDKNIVLMAKVGSVLIKGNVKNKNRTQTLYQIVLEFLNIKDNDKVFLEEIMERRVKADLLVFEDRIKGVKFHVSDD